MSSRSSVITKEPTNDLSFVPEHPRSSSYLHGDVEQLTKILTKTEWRPTATEDVCALGDSECFPLRGGQLPSPAVGYGTVKGL